MTFRPAGWKSSRLIGGTVIYLGRSQALIIISPPPSLDIPQGCFFVQLKQVEVYRVDHFNGFIWGSVFKVYSQGISSSPFTAPRANEGQVILNQTVDIQVSPPHTTILDHKARR